MSNKLVKKIIQQAGQVAGRDVVLNVNIYIIQNTADEKK
ncbi:hypothetical protein C8D83_1011106 [Halothiobacillus neapolitanus]|nr:hypothetical protein C8D83_1011106 [Halothiobacillus neapolitanus]